MSTMTIDMSDIRPPLICSACGCEAPPPDHLCRIAPAGRWVSVEELQEFEVLRNDLAAAKDSDTWCARALAAEKRAHELDGNWHEQSHDTWRERALAAERNLASMREACSEHASEDAALVRAAANRAAARVDGPAKYALLVLAEELGR